MFEAFIMILRGENYGVNLYFHSNIIVNYIFRFFVGILRFAIKLAIIALVIYFVYQGVMYFM